MTVETPLPKEIKYFVERVRAADKQTAVSHYVRTGQSLRGAPDETVVKVLQWLDGLAANGENEPNAKA